MPPPNEPPLLLALKQAILEFHDDPKNFDFSAVPFWGFNRVALANAEAGHSAAYADILLPHHYVRPDQLCSPPEAPGAAPPLDNINRTLIAQPWEGRRDVLLGRFTHYCRGLNPDGSNALVVNRQRLLHCPRTFFSDLAARVGSVAGVTLDVAPTNTVGSFPGNDAFLRPDGTKLAQRDAVPLDLFAQNKYILVTDGQVSAGKLAHALALGSVVRPA